MPLVGRSLQDDLLLLDASNSGRATAGTAPPISNLMATGFGKQAQTSNLGAAKEGKGGRKGRE